MQEIRYPEIIKTTSGEYFPLKLKENKYYILGKGNEGFSLFFFFCIMTFSWIFSTFQLSKFQLCQNYNIFLLTDIMIYNKNVK